MLNRQKISARLSNTEIGRWGCGMARSERITRGDNDLNPQMPMPTETKAAAVLVPLVLHEEEITVLLTQRTNHLKDHAGQVSFPGGRVEESDYSHEAAALRETEEEIGVTHEHIELIGYLDVYMTRTGYEVTPVVASPTTFSSNPRPFEAGHVRSTLNFLIVPANHQRVTREDIKRQFYAMQYQEHFIWGATAGMLVNLSELLADQ